MAKRKRGQPINGWVILDKPMGVTSTDAVAQVRRLFDARKAGHAGTLDPMATGVLAIALGEATKTVPFAMDAEKVYRFTTAWGEARDSDDAEGKVTATSAARPSIGAIEAALPRFTGSFDQTPPAYSAVHIGGERAYDLAREGMAVTLEPRRIEVHESRLVEIPDPDHAVFEIRCGKGTYVRSWVRDLALYLGTFGHVSALRRTRIGSFSVENAIGLETLKTFGHIPPAFAYLRPLSTALDGILAIAVSGPDTVRLRSGSPVLIRANMFAKISGDAGGDLPNGIQGLTVFLSTGEGEPVALAEIAEGELRPFRVFNFGTDDR